MNVEDVYLSVLEVLAMIIYHVLTALGMTLLLSPILLLVGLTEHFPHLWAVVFLLRLIQDCVREVNSRLIGD